ncbi:MAG: cyclic nucleotide-binding protein [Reyranella sp.]|nr:cyclic nucleotide-binding protein [Reyranella sp.]
MASTRFGNHLLDGMPQGDSEALMPRLVKVDLILRQVLEQSNAVTEFVYFADRGLISVVAETTPNHRAEVGMIGFEGMTGLSVLMSDGYTSNEVMVQSAGTAWRIEAIHLAAALDDSRPLTKFLLRYAHNFLMQASQTALANARGLLEQRLARWLLMWQDRLRQEALPVTHEFLSLLLGVRRQGVTVTLHELEGRHLIKATRGTITILDRDGLRDVAGGFYGFPEAEYAASMVSANGSVTSRLRSV